MEPLWQFYMDFGRAVRLTKLGTFMGLKWTCSGKKAALKTAEHPTLLRVQKRCQQGTHCTAKGAAVGSNRWCRAPNILCICFSSFASYRHWPGALRWISISSRSVKCTPGVHLTVRFHLKVNSFGWTKAWQVEVMRTLASEARTWSEIKH